VSKGLTFHSTLCKPFQAGFYRPYDPTSSFKTGGKPVDQASVPPGLFHHVTVNKLKAAASPVSVVCTRTNPVLCLLYSVVSGTVSCACWSGDGIRLIVAVGCVLHVGTANLAYLLSVMFMVLYHHHRAVM